MLGMTIISMLLFMLLFISGICQQFIILNLLSLLKMTDQQHIELVPQNPNVIYQDLTPAHRDENLQPPMQSQYNMLGADLRGELAANPEVNVPRQLQFQMHKTSLCFNIFLLIGVAVWLVIYFKEINFLVNPVSAIIVFYYFVYIMSLFDINLFENLNAINHGVTIQTQYNNIRKIDGNLELTAICHHKKRNSLTVYPVVTHTNIQTVTALRTEDISGQVGRIRGKKTIIFIQFQVVHRFADNQSQQKFESIHALFKSRNKKDDFQRYSCNHVIPGLVKQQTFYIGEHYRMYRIGFFIFGFLGLIWPYSMWVEHNVERYSVTITKVLTISIK